MESPGSENVSVAQASYPQLGSINPEHGAKCSTLFTDNSAETALALIPHPKEVYTPVEIDQLHSRIAELESQLSVLQENQYEQEVEASRASMAFEEMALERDQQARDNDVLRSLIVALRQPQAPCFEDGYYIYRMQRLNESMKSWVVSAFKAKEFEQPMSETEEEQLVHLLRTNLPEHIVWLEAIRQRSGITYTAIHTKPLARIALARHLVSLSIWKNIFRPLCFGISGELKDGMKAIMNSIYTEGTSSLFQLIGRKRDPKGHGYKTGC